MLPEGSIRATNIWKRFRADIRQSKLRDELKYMSNRVRGRVDADAWRWALRDVDIVVDPGDSVGLIGHNGSGKSTLLKILTGVMYPRMGRVEVSGRVGAMISVTEGIHPDLSGRENLYLYGSLLGLPRGTVAARFDEIVEFAEVGHAIDRQVKFYSSGMKMRLGFAVAAFLEPDVLIVDEVLSVGDASFQQKCLERMRLVLNQGATLVFVSHDLAATEATCNRAYWLNDGVIEMEGPVRPVLGEYRRHVEEVAASGRHADESVRVAKLAAFGPDGGIPMTQEPLCIRFTLQSDAPRDASLYLGVSEGTATPIFVVKRRVHLVDGDTHGSCVVDNLPLPKGRFYLWLGLIDDQDEDVIGWNPAHTFDVTGPLLDVPPRAVARLAPVHVVTTWDLDG